MYGIFTYIWLICMVNVGKYTSPMDAMGKTMAFSRKAILTIVEIDSKNVGKYTH